MKYFERPVLGPVSGLSGVGGPLYRYTKKHVRKWAGLTPDHTTA